MRRLVSRKPQVEPLPKVSDKPGDLKALKHPETPLNSGGDGSLDAADDLPRKDD